MNHLTHAPRGASALARLERELAVNDLLEEAETTRRVIQAQTAIVLLLHSGAARDAESLLAALERVAVWVQDLTSMLHEKADLNIVAGDLLPVVGALQATQLELRSVIRGSGSSVVRPDVRATHRRLASLVSRTDEILAGTSAELRSFSSGCACIVDRREEGDN